MKYHDKLNLRSPIYKYNNPITSRTPTKSPIKPAVNPSDLFQKVCCPNCKYAFKIIRQEMIKQNPVQKPTPFMKKSRITERRQISTQTEGILTQKNGYGPAKSLTSLPKLSKTYELGGTHNLKQYEQSQINSILQPQNSENRYLRQSEFKFKPLSLSPHSKLSKSRNLLKTLDPKHLKMDEFEDRTAKKSRNRNQQYENLPFEYQDETMGQQIDNLNYYQIDRERQSGYKRGKPLPSYNNNVDKQTAGYDNTNRQRLNSYEQSGLVSPHASSEKLSMNNGKFMVPEPVQITQTPSRLNKNFSYPQQISFNPGIRQSQHIAEQNKSKAYSNVREQQPILHSVQPCCKCKDSSQFQQLITQIVLKNQQSEAIIRQLQEFCKLAAEEIQVPSFCKMLTLTQ